MSYVLKYGEFISKLEKELNIKLFTYEKKYLDALLVSRKENRKLIIHKARRSLLSFSRVDLLYHLIIVKKIKIE